MKDIFILFGEMGSGKTHWGTMLTHYIDMDFFDGDDVVPKEMAEKISKFQSLTRQIVFEYVSKNLGPAILDRAKRSANGLIVSQALYSDSDRKYLKELLEANGYNVVFYWVQSPFMKNLKQLSGRKNSFSWKFYWLKNKFFFQKPTHDYKVFNIFNPEIRAKIS